LPYNRCTYGDRVEPASALDQEMKLRQCLSLRLALACVALVLASPLPGAAQTRKQFGNWVAICQSDAAGYCTANTRVGHAPSGEDSAYAFQLHVWRARAGDPLQLTFLAGLARPDEGSALQARVDRNAPLALEAGTGYRAVRSSSSYVLLDQDTVDTLLAAMRSGKRLELRFADARGRTVVAAFPLNGFKQAVGLFEASSGKRKAAAPAHPAEQTTPRKMAAKSAAAEQPTVTEAVPATRPEPPAATPPEQAAKSDAGQPAVTEPVPATRPEPPAATPPKQPAKADAAEQPVVTEPVPATRPEPPAATPPKEPIPSAGGKRRVVTEVAPAQRSGPYAAAPSPGPPPRGRRARESIRQFTCRGNEPGWSLAIDKDLATLTVPGQEPESQQFAGKFRIAGEGRTPIVQWKGRASGVKGEIAAMITQEACKDPMSEREGQTDFAFKAQVTLLDGRKVLGCCNAGLEAAAAPPGAPGVAPAPVANLSSKSEENWARLLPELLPAVQACLAQTPGQSPYVTKAWPMNKGMVGVRTRGGDGSWFDCIAQSDGKGVERMETLTRGDLPLPGENAVLFTPVGGAPRQGNCWQQERVLDPGGNLLGYLSSNVC
jgi:uncharacterized membrane protein